MEKSKTLLHVACSPRRHRSLSGMLAEKFTERFLILHPEFKLQSINLWERQLPEFDEKAVAAKYHIIHRAQSADIDWKEAAVWHEITAIFDEFNAADKFVFSVPMWNFLIPYKLKHYLDIIIQPGMAFKIKHDGSYEGLVKNRPVMLIMSRGGQYCNSAAETWDFQRRYLKIIFSFIGFSDIREVIAEPTLNGTPDEIEKAKTAAAAAVSLAAETF